jgi:hypothetical protein
MGGNLCSGVEGNDGTFSIFLPWFLLRSSSWLLVALDGDDTVH